MGVDLVKMKVILHLLFSPFNRYFNYYYSKPTRLLNRKFGLSVVVLIAIYFIFIREQAIFIHIHIGEPNFVDTSKFRFKREVKWGPAYVDHGQRHPIYVNDKNPDNLFYDKEEEKRLIDKFQFNKYLSDRTPINRPMRDFRHTTCMQRQYPDDMPAASVIMVFYNEAASVVLRTVHSVLNKSPPHLIHEILLYDDNSDLEEVVEGSWFTRHIKTLPKVRLERSKHGRGGLIKAKTFAGKLATGKILVYLDAHCECNDGWLEPLIYPIYLNRTACTTPNIDSISWQRLEIHAPEVVEVTGGLNWILNMLWSPLSVQEQARRAKDPYPLTADIRTPTMAGGLFAIDRAWFIELGMYDEGQDIWGGENIDLSFRVWLCGGTQWLCPCSKVAHVFRPKHPYTFGKGDEQNFKVVMKNYKRNALVWLDGPHLDFFYKWKPQAIDVDAGDVSGRLALKRKLQCKSFDYFLENVWPLPAERDCVATGMIKGTDNQCLDNAGGSDTFGQHLQIWGCHNLGNNQFWMYRKDRRIMGLLYVFDVDGLSPGSNVILVWIDHKSDRQFFDYNTKTQQLIHRRSGLCVDRHVTSRDVIIERCDEYRSQQRWTFQYTYSDRPL
ncbi:hypothetical protein ACHWQZ_G008481 [Mnemiopsis leidyi]